MIIFGKLKEVKLTKGFIYFTMNNSFTDMQKNKRDKHIDEDNQGDGEHKKTHIFERDSSDAYKLSDADNDILKKRQDDRSNKESNNKGAYKESQGRNISNKDSIGENIEKGIK